MLLANTSRRRTAVWLLTAIALTAAPAAAQQPIQTQKLNSVLRAALNDMPLAGAALRPMGTTLEPVPGFDVFIRGPVTTAELEALGVQVRTDLGDIKTAFVPEDALAAVTNLGSVLRVEGSVTTEEELDVSVPATGAAGLRGGPPNFAGLNGTGVVLGDVDSGVDWTHEDFDDPAGNTRIQYIWDQTDPIGPAPGGSFPTGSEWTSADIDANLPRQKDTSGHGSHVLSIMGGDGSKTGNAQPAYQYVGMAPGADLIMVKTTFQTTSIVDGVNYVFQKAGGQPAVCNLSLGSHYGPHDGTSTFEQALAALTGHGKLLFKSAGNENNSNIHAQTIAAGGIGQAIRLNVSAGGAGAVAMDGYYEMGDDISITVQTPNGTLLGPVTKGNVLLNTVAAQGRIYIENNITPTNSGDHNIYIQIDSGGGPAVALGNWLIRFIAVSIPGGGEVDVWRFAHTLPGASSFTLGQQNDELVSEPGNSDSLCTIGSWTTKRTWTAIDNNSYLFTGAVFPGFLSPFSSPGPTRDGRLKPNFTAPGSAIGAVRSVDAAYGVPLILPDGVHAVNQGTSMASPHAAGAAALVMQARGPMWPSQMCQFLSSTALADAMTGAVPNTLWGHGKLFLDVATAVAISEMSLDYGDHSVQLSWSFLEGVEVSNLRAERRIGGDGAFAPVVAVIEDVSGGSERSFRLVDTQVLPGVTYQYQILGETDFGPVSFGPYVASVPQQTTLAWALAAPAPNPARLGNVQFVYSAATRGEASMVVYDARGREVARPLTGVVEPGTHTLSWAGTGRSGQRLTAGVYMVVFRGGNQEFRQKLVLLD